MLAELKYSFSHTFAESAAIAGKCLITVDVDVMLETRRRQLVPLVPLNATECNQQVDSALYNAESVAWATSQSTHHGLHRTFLLVIHQFIICTTVISILSVVSHLTHWWWSSNGSQLDRNYRLAFIDCDFFVNSSASFCFVVSTMYLQEWLITPINWIEAINYVRDNLYLIN